MSVAYVLAALVGGGVGGAYGHKYCTIPFVNKKYTGREHMLEDFLTDNAKQPDFDKEARVPIVVDSLLGVVIGVILLFAYRRIRV
jgi:hypothetical protein